MPHTHTARFELFPTVSPDVTHPDYTVRPSGLGLIDTIMAATYPQPTFAAIAIGVGLQWIPIMLFAGISDCHHPTGCGPRGAKPLRKSQPLHASPYGLPQFWSGCHVDLTGYAILLPLFGVPESLLPKSQPVPACHWFWHAQQ